MQSRHQKKTLKNSAQVDGLTPRRGQTIGLDYLIKLIRLNHIGKNVQRPV